MAGGGRRDRENGASAEAEHSTKKQAVDVVTSTDEICIQTIRALGADLPQVRRPSLETAGVVRREGSDE